METQQKVLIGLVILIVVLIMVAYYHSTQIVGKYKVLDATGQKIIGDAEISQRQAVVSGVAEVQHDLTMGSTKYKVGSFGFGGFALHDDKGPAGQLSQNHLTGDLVVSIGTAINPLKPVVIVPDDDKKDGNDDPAEKPSGYFDNLMKVVTGGGSAEHKEVFSGGGVVGTHGEGQKEIGTLKNAGTLKAVHIDANVADQGWGNACSSMAVRIYRGTDKIADFGHGITRGVPNLKYNGVVKSNTTVQVGDRVVLVGSGWYPGCQGRINSATVTVVTNS